MTDSDDTLTALVHQAKQISEVRTLNYSYMVVEDKTHESHETKMTQADVPWNDFVEVSEAGHALVGRL